VVHAVTEERPMGVKNAPRIVVQKDLVRWLNTSIRESVLEGHLGP